MCVRLVARSGAVLMKQNNTGEMEKAEIAISSGKIATKTANHPNKTIVKANNMTLIWNSKVHVQMISRITQRLVAVESLRLANRLPPLAVSGRRWLLPRQV